MMHSNYIQKCLTDQSSKGMKKGLHYFGDVMIVSNDVDFNTVIIILLRSVLFDSIDSKYC